MSLVESIERCLARVPLRLELPPPRDVRLRVRVSVVYFAIDMPIGGVTLRIPVFATVTPMSLAHRAVKESGVVGKGLG